MGIVPIEVEDHSSVGRRIPADSAGRLLLDAGLPPPVPIREDQALDPDRLQPRDGLGIELIGQFAWLDVPPPAGAPELNKEALKEARAKTALKFTLQLAPAGRMRMSLDSATFPLPAGSELRARVDRYGHVLVWPDDVSYRTLPPGTLRAMFSERRVDVGPLVAGRERKAGDGTLLGLPTKKSVVSGPLGKLELEQASVGGVAESGQLVCRMLVELVGVQPSVAACSGNLVPLKAAFAWEQGGRFGFEVASVTGLQDIPVGQLFVLSAGAVFRPGKLPPPTNGVLLTPADMIELRTRANSQRPEPAPEGSPPEGLTAVNRTNSLRYVLLDGVPIAWVAPGKEKYVMGPRDGRYAVSWRDFLGTETEPAKAMFLPTRIVMGSDLDAGAKPE